MRLFIIGNGFDLAHELSTNIEKDFKPIAESIGQISHFWDMYQTNELSIWSDFENCLAHPDFNSLEEIFHGYEPDYQSEHESDRNSIITQVDLNGKLFYSLNEFASNAECALNSKNANEKYQLQFQQKDLFINFNYTHTLEKLYCFDKKQVLHIHGEVGKGNLIFGYPEGMYEPAKYFYDPKQKGNGSFSEVEIQDFLENMKSSGNMDFYSISAYQQLIEKTKSFKKKYQLEMFQDFINNMEITEIHVIGHSCKIDFPYFSCLNNKYQFAEWFFTAHTDYDVKNIKNLILKTGIKKYEVQKEF